MNGSLTVTELAKVLLVDPRHVRKLIAAKFIPALQLAGCTRIRPQSFIRVLSRFYFGGDFKSPGEMPMDWLKPTEVAKRFGCSRATVLRWVRMRQDHIPFYKFGEHTIRFRETELEQWEKQLERKRHGEEEQGG